MGCHWSGSESRGDEEPSELEAGNGSGASGVPNDVKKNGSSREDRQVETDRETTQVGSG